jgi:uncharacterized membrane protein YhiD involved in acid resistance
MAIAMTYDKTYRGLSYSRNFVQALVMGSIVAAMVMQAIGDNLARGLGMIGALAIIRFRTNFKDPRDIVFMFASLASGIACGVFGYIVAVIGTIGFCSTAIFLYFSPFGRDRYFDGMLRFNMENGAGNSAKIENILNQYCRNFALVTLRELAQGNRLDYAYHIKMKNGKSRDEFILKIKVHEAVKDVNLLLQETTVEL